MTSPKPSFHRWALVLAAGQGTRFKSERAKVLHPLCGKPLAAHLLDRLPELGVRGTLVVVGYQAELVQRELAGRDRQFVLQSPQLGTGHAVSSARALLEGLRGSLLVLYGDVPLVSSQTLRRLFEVLEESDAAAVLLTAQIEDATGYGRILRDAAGQLVDIVEERDATPEQKRIREFNPGLYCFRIESLLPALEQLGNDNDQKEYLLTDVPAILLRRGERVLTVKTDDPEETRGINDRLQLSRVEQDLRRRIADHWMREGVSMLDPDSVLIGAEVSIGPDTVLYPGVILEGDTRIGPGCIIRGYCHLQNARLGERVTVDHGTIIRDSRVEAGTTVGPYAHLRSHALVGPDCRVGNFVEIKKSTLGAGTKSAHLTYLGDAEIGSQVNIGAGVITCNYDGRQKHRTVIQDRVFVGSGCQLIAPLTVHEGAYVAAGSTITEDVPADSLAIARGRQVVKPGWAKKKDDPS